jgi:nucleoid-associated protein YgaU
MNNRYKNANILKTDFTNRPYYKGKQYPNIPLSEFDVYVITTTGDRLDNLAYSYYGDSTLWWVIAMANNNATNGTLYPVPGTQLRIPTDINYVLRLFEQFNQAR